MNIGRSLTIILVFVTTVTVSLQHQTQITDNLERGFRLPNNTFPLHYDLSLSTNIHRGDFMFNGLARINIRVLENSDTITLHYRQLMIRNVNILHVNGTVLQQNVRFMMSHPLEFLDISPSNPLTIDEELIVEISYAGILRSDGAGFIRSSYVNSETNETFWLASVQFKNTDARHAFPCYDEIKYRSTFRLQIEHHESYHALSNKFGEQNVANDDGFVTTTFEITPLMPTNLMTFTISNFDHISVMNEFDVMMSTYARPEAVAGGATNFSLIFGQEAFRRLNDWFGAYSLTKLDQIAIPDLDWSTEVCMKWFQGMPLKCNADFMLPFQ